MHSPLVSSVFVLAVGAGLVSAVTPPTFARASFVPGPMGPLSGNVLFTALGEGVIVSLEIGNFPVQGGPWPYHGISPLHFPLAALHFLISCASPRVSHYQ